MLGRQQQKSHEARRRICEATIACLVEHGYEGTSTTRIVERAGVSRGALQHHFPSKQDLIVAATNHLFEDVIERSGKLLAQLESGQIDFRGFAFRLWKGFHNSTRYHAILELMTAARSDAELRERITPTIQSWNQTIDQKMAALFDSASQDEEDVAVLMQMTRCMFRGLALRAGTGITVKMSERIVARWVELVEPLLIVRTMAQVAR